MSKSNPRSYAASFVVTVGLLSGAGSIGCGSSHHTHNPPMPSAEHVEGNNPPGPHHEHGHDHNHEDHKHEHGEGHSNPPAVDQPTGNPPAPDPEAATHHDHINPPAPKPAEDATAPTLKAAPDGWKVSTRADGTCWASAKTECPKDKTMSCNPPRPMQVACP